MMTLTHKEKLQKINKIINKYSKKYHNIDISKIENRNRLATLLMDSYVILLNIKDIIKKGKKNNQNANISITFTKDAIAAKKQSESHIDIQIKQENI